MKIRFCTLCLLMIAVIIFIVCVSQSQAQAPPQFGDNYRPDYETFRIDKFLDQSDVSYTGDLGLSIPLLTVPARLGHDFGIKIQYNSNITQQQSASWVGLGWTLDIGGVERSVIGRTDDQPQGLLTGYNLGPDGANPPYRAEMVGRLSINHPSIIENPPAVMFKDQADDYRLIIDGGGIEMLPFPQRVSGRDTLDQNSFLPLQWKPWQIKAWWTEGANQLYRFDVIKEDGSIYQFGGIGIGYVDYITVTGTTSTGYPQSWRFPYRWNLVKISYPDGSTIDITYNNYNATPSTKFYKYWESLIIDRSAPDEKNLFGPGAYGIPQGQVLYEYSCPETLKTSSHYAYFKSSTPTSDSTDRNRKLNEIILYQNGTNKELRRVVFTYATNDNPVSDTSYFAPDWSSNTRLNTNQLTLTNIISRSGSAPGENELPPYIFTYYKNPKINRNYLNVRSSYDNTFPGYFVDTVFNTAWRLKDITLPTGAKFTYHYGSYEVRLDPEGMWASPGSSPFNYRSQPRCRITSRDVYEPLDNITRTFTYTYGDAVYDPPSRPIGMFYMPSYYRWVGFTAIDYYRLYRGCQPGHRWVQVNNPDGSWRKTWFTSSYQKNDADLNEKQPDVFYETGTLRISSRAGQRGLVWKTETSSQSTVYKYKYFIEGAFTDKYTYYRNLVAGGQTDYIEQTTINATLDSLNETKDGVATSTAYAYNITRRNYLGLGSPPGYTPNGLVSSEIRSGSFFDQVTKFAYAFKIYTQMDNLYMWSQLYSKTISKLSKNMNDDEYKEWTTWSLVNNRWLPKKNWIWNTSASATVAPTDTGTGSLCVKTYTYDTQGYSNVTQETDANNFTTTYYYSSDTTNPFTNDGLGLARGNLTGIYRPLSSPLLRISKKYDHYGNVVQQKDENNLDSIRYQYDPLGRLLKVFGPGGAKLNEYLYTFYGPFNRAFPTSIMSKAYRSTFDSAITTNFYNGFGYERQNQTQVGDTAIVFVTTYDGLQRIDSVYKGYHKQSSLVQVYDSLYFSHSSSGNPKASPYPFTRNEYYADGSGRLRHTHAPGSVFQTIESDSAGLKGFTRYYYSKANYYTPEGSDPVSTNPGADPSWTTNAGTLHAALADGTSYNDATLTSMTFLSGIPYDASYTVKLRTFSIQPDSTGTVLVRFRASSTSGGAGPMGPMSSSVDPILYVTLLEGTTWKGEYQILTKNLSSSYSTYSFTVPITSIANINNIYVKVRGQGQPSSQVILNVSWARVDIIYPVLFNTSVVDENAVKQLKWSDSFGNLIRSVADSGGLNLTTKLEYDVIGRMTRTIDPKGLVSSYVYNTRGFLKSKTTQDAGTTNYRYDLGGNLRFEQSADYAAKGKYVYRKYDALGRVLEIGEYTGSNFWTIDSTTLGNPASDAPTSGGSLKAKYVYDQNTTGNPVLSSARNLFGKVFYVKTNNDTLFYSYDDFGRTEWQIHKIIGLPSKKVEYWYDLQGNITRINYLDLGNSAYNTFLFYKYDQAGRLDSVFSGKDSLGIAKTLDAKYTYLANGRVRRMQLGRAQGVDYVYNERDWLTQINHQNISPVDDPGKDGGNGIPTDKFGMVMDYNNIGHIGAAQNATPQYNGNISWLMYNMSGVTYTGPLGTTSLVGCTYAYDNANRLAAADFGYYTNAWQPTSAYDIKSMTYDPNGNLSTLRRYGKNATIMDSLTYNYASNTNRLLNVDDAVSSSAYTIDLDDERPNNYYYNQNGQLVADTINAITAIGYNWQNLPISLTTSGTWTNLYRYDAAGNRMYKYTDLAGEPYYYINDVQGRTLAVVKADGTGFINLWGNDMIGQMKLDTNRTRYYYLKDHLGTIRMTVQAGETMLQDDFSSGLGQWTTVFGSGFSIINGELADSSAGDNFMVNSSSKVLTDGIIAVDVKCVNGTGDMSMIVRYQDNSNFYLVQPLGNTLTIYERLGGTWLSRASGTLPTTIQSNKFYRLAITAEGGTISAYWDSSFIVSWTDATPWLSGKVGFRQTLSRSIRWDNIVVTTNGPGAVVSADDFDPWGMVLEGRSQNIGMNDTRYKFTSKERDFETNYDYFGARYYDSRVGRWMSCDPLQEKYPAWSPYSYVMNNPIRSSDPDGKYVVDRTTAMRYSIGEAVTLMAMEQIPGVNFVFMGMRQAIGDPSFKPNVADWTIETASFGFSKFISSVGKSLSGFDKAFMKAFEGTMMVGEAGVAAAVLGTETSRKLSIDEAVFNKALESGLAVKAKVYRNITVHKGHGEYDTKTMEVESETQIMLNPKKWKEQGFRNVEEASGYFQRNLLRIKDDIEKENIRE
jgi:RHS repeat-associated protein